MRNPSVRTVSCTTRAGSPVKASGPVSSRAIIANRAGSAVTTAQTGVRQHQDVGHLQRD